MSINTVKLTERENQVLIALSFGLTNPEIGDHLGLMESTIKTHARKMFRKLKARDRAHAVRIAMELELLELRSHKAVGRVEDADPKEPVLAHIAACYEARFCPCRGEQVGGDG